MPPLEIRLSGVVHVHEVHADEVHVEVVQVDEACERTLSRSTFLAFS